MSTSAGRMLRDLRQRAGLTGYQAADAAGISQSKISKLENDALALHDEDMDRLCALYRATREEREKLDSLRVRPRSWSRPRVPLARDLPRVSKRIGVIRDDAVVIRCYQPVRVPEPLQTFEYGVRCADDWTAEHDPLISEHTQDATVILTEGALRWCVGGSGVMADQLDALIDASRVPGIRIGVIPWDRPVTVFPRQAWTIYDSQLVLAATDLALSAIEQEGDIAVYEDMWDRLRDLASFDDEGRSELARIRDEYARLRVDPVHTKA